MFKTEHFTLANRVRRIFISMVIAHLLCESTAGSYLQKSVSPTDSFHNSSSLQKCRDGYSRLTPKQRLRFVDASGKPGSGMFGGNFLWFGSYSECKKQSNARYCLSFFRSLINLDESESQETFLKWGICAPKSCTNQGIIENFDFLLVNVSKIPVKRLGKKDEVKLNCDESIEYDSGTIITIVFCGFIAALCILATAVELLIEFKVPKNENSTSKSPNELPIESGKNEHTPLISDKKPSPAESKEVAKSGTYDILSCFSLTRNINAIFNTNVSSSDLTCLHGIRVLTMFWIIFIHFGRTASLLLFPTDNINDVENMMRRFPSMVFHNGALGVDTFFVLSGLLVAYVNLRKLDKNNGKMFWLKFYFHRYWRLTPAYMFVVLLVAKLVPHFGQGPLWNQKTLVAGCSKYWWTNMLYINNIYPEPKAGDLCIGQTCYLSVDMQLFVFSPILFLLAYRLSDNEFILDVYVLPYSHAQSYIIGVVMGYFLYKFSSTRLKLSPVKVWFLWVMAVGSVVIFIYSPYDAIKNYPDEMSRGGRVIYSSLRYTCWGLAIVWFIFACHFGYAGLIKNLLSAKFWIPLSRINYLAFIVHIDLINVVVYNIEAPVHYTTFTLVIYYIGVLVLSYACAFIITVAVEIPCSNLEPILTRSSLRKT